MKFLYSENEHVWYRKNVNFAEPVEIYANIYQIEPERITSRGNVLFIGVTVCAMLTLLFGITSSITNFGFSMEWLLYFLLLTVISYFSSIAIKYFYKSFKIVSQYRKSSEILVDIAINGNRISGTVVKIENHNLIHYTVVLNGNLCTRKHQSLKNSLITCLKRNTTLAVLEYEGRTVLL